MRIRNRALSSDENLCCGELIDAVKALQESMLEFSDYVQHHAQSISIYDPEHSDRSPDGKLLPLSDLLLVRRRCAEMFDTLEHVDDLDGRFTRTLTGVIALPPEGLTWARAANASKERLIAAWRALDGIGIQITDTDLQLQEQVLLRDDALEKVGRARFHYREASRLFQIFDQCPLRIGFLWRPVRPIASTTCAALCLQLEQELKESKGGDRVGPTLDLAMLRSLPTDEPLAIVDSTNTEPCANIKFLDANGLEKWRQTSSVLPFIVPAPVTCKVSASAKSDKQRKQRKDIRIEERPFLPRRRVYRYLPHARDSHSSTL